MSYWFNNEHAGQYTPVDAEQVNRVAPAIGEHRSRSRYADVTTIRLGLRARAQRGRFFNPRLFADPAWDMLLELYAASLIKRRLSISRLAERSAVPLTTALRWIAALEKEGLLDRHNNQFDRRQVLLTLSEKGREAMTAYFDEIDVETKFF